MDYICTTPAHGLTVGETYTELLDNPSELGACVKNNNGNRCYLPRRLHFIVKPTAEERRASNADDPTLPLGHVTVTARRRAIEERHDTARIMSEHE